MPQSGEFAVEPAIRSLAREFDALAGRVRALETEHTRKGMVERDKRFKPRCPRCPHCQASGN